MTTTGTAKIEIASRQRRDMTRSQVLDSDQIRMRSGKFRIRPALLSDLSHAGESRVFCFTTVMHDFGMDQHIIARKHQRTVLSLKKKNVSKRKKNVDLTSPPWTHVVSCSLKASHGYPSPGIQEWRCGRLEKGPTDWDPLGQPVSTSLEKNHGRIDDPGPSPF